MVNPVSKPISAGDPVTSDLINNIIGDLKSIAKENAAQSITLSSSGDSTTPNPVSISSKVYSTTVSGKDVNPSNKPSASGSWTFDTPFPKPPRCWIQVSSGGAKLNEPQLRVHTVITSVSTTKVNFQIRSGAGAAPAKMDFYIFAVEA